MFNATRFTRTLVAVQTLSSLAMAAGVWLLGAGVAGAILAIAGSVTVSWSASKQTRARTGTLGTTYLPGFKRNG